MAVNRRPDRQASLSPIRAALKVRTGSKGRSVPNGIAGASASEGTVRAAGLSRGRSATRGKTGRRTAGPAGAVRPVVPAAVDGSEGDEIYDRIRGAIVEHRLLPGTKLVEERLAEIFDVSRARVREVLARLAHEQIVELFPQRGAYVAKPSIEQAMDIFEARRLIEPALILRLIDRLDADKVARLKQHQKLELEARRRDDERAVVRLSGEFHILLAELAGNSMLARTMRELATLTCLAIILYDAPTATSCRADEHSAIVEAIARRDAGRAQALMLGHLDHIQGSLRLEGPTEEADLAEILGG